MQKGALPVKRTLTVFGIILITGACLWLFNIYNASVQKETLDQETIDVAQQLQCPICNGLSVADSPSGLASQMRQMIHDKLSAGQTKSQVIQFFVSKYGQTILMNPPKQGFSLGIWIVPVLILFIGLFVIYRTARAWASVPVENVSLDSDLVAPKAEDLAKYEQQLQEEFGLSEIVVKGEAR